MPVVSQYAFENHSRSWNGYIISPDRKKSGFDMPETQAAHQYFYDWVNKYKVQPTRQQIQGGINDMFYGQKVAITLNSTPNGFVGFQEATGGKFTMGDSTFPSRPSGTVGTISAADGSVIYGKSSYKDAAWGLVKLLSSAECSKWTALNGAHMVPGANIEAWNDPAVWKLAPPYKTLATFLNDLEKRGQKPGGIPVPANSRRAEFADLYNNEWPAMLYGEKPYTKQTVSELQQKLQAIMEKPPP